MEDNTNVDETNIDERLIPFLRNLADSVEQSRLRPAQLQRIGEFFMAYQFQEQAASGDQGSPDFSQDDLLKFLSLGWYVYQILLRQETLPDLEEDVD